MLLENDEFVEKLNLSNYFSSRIRIQKKKFSNLKSQLFIKEFEKLNAVRKYTTLINILNYGQLLFKNFIGVFLLFNL